MAPEIVTRALTLLLPVLLGAATRRLFPDTDRAIFHLNRYALYIAFPALVFRGIADAEFALPTNAFFWAVIPGVLLVALALIGTLGRQLAPRHRGSLALVASFGNVAYLGLPVVVQTYGDQSVGIASLAVAMHVGLSMAFGPWLLVRWSGGKESVDLRRVLLQPLLWAPVVGLAARWLPAGVRNGSVEILAPLGGSAAPVALFLLGLYIRVHQRSVRQLTGAATQHIAVRLLVMPALTLGACRLGLSFSLLSAAQAQVLFVLASMPAAITTFAIAREMQVGTGTITQTIVGSSLASLASIPASLWLARSLLA
ncbi:MAG: AEC family transporter [Myxococcota bacterium]